MAVVFTYDPSVDAGYLKTGEGPSVETKVVNDDINLDFNIRGGLVGIEILSVSLSAPGLLASVADTPVAAE